MEKLDYQSFKDKLGLWAPKFKKFIEGEEMWKIYQKLKADGSKETIVPESKNTFRAFQTVDPKNLKVVFFLMDPYPRRYSNKEMQATGIAMDCSNSPDGKIQPSLVNWYGAISKELGHKVNYSPSLEYLHEQGVMLLNTDLTCKLNKTASHERLWEPFMKYFLEEVVGGDNSIIYVLCGQASLRMEKYINPFCRIFKLTHPAAASHTHTDWDSKGVFEQINKIIWGANRFHIYWDKRKWEESKELPF